MAKRSRSHRSRFWSMRGRFNGVVFESGFEKKFLEQCYQLGVRVTRSDAEIRYRDAQGRLHRYYPDFYWPEYDHTIEIKGTWAFRENHGNVREKYMAAMDHFKGRYSLITEKELKTTFVADLRRKLHDIKTLRGDQ